MAGALAGAAASQEVTSEDPKKRLEEEAAKAVAAIVGPVRLAKAKRKNDAMVYLILSCLVL